MDKYSILKKIGQGSFGNVWLVRDKKDRKQYVLKRINIKNASKRDLKAAHLEVQLLAFLKHPNIVSYRDAFKGGEGILCIVMSYCDGGDIYTKIKSQNGIHFQEAQIVQWFIQICMALQYLHERNILHRDLKTQNIFLTKGKVVKLGDLGIAKVLDSEFSMATTLIGTPSYMSPELFSHKPYNHKSDIWALGCCIYEMVTLRHAFNARDINSLSYKILRGKLPEMPSHYSHELLDLIHGMLHLIPENRPPLDGILCDNYIKKHIKNFLETNKRKLVDKGLKIEKSPREKRQNSITDVDDEMKVKELHLEGRGVSRKFTDRLVIDKNCARECNRDDNLRHLHKPQFMVNGQEMKLGQKKLETPRKNYHAANEISTTEKIPIIKVNQPLGDIAKHLHDSSMTHNHDSSTKLVIRENLTQRSRMPKSNSEGNHTTIRRNFSARPKNKEKPRGEERKKTNVTAQTETEDQNNLQDLINALSLLDDTLKCSKFDEFAILRLR